MSLKNIYLDGNEPRTGMEAEEALTKILDILRNGSIAVSGGGGGGSSVLYPVIVNYGVSANPTLPNGQAMYIFANGAAGDRNATLPLASANPGARLVIVNNDLSFSINPQNQGGDLINWGQAFHPIFAQSSRSFVSDGVSNWLTGAVDENNAVDISNA